MIKRKTSSRIVSRTNPRPLWQAQGLARTIFKRFQSAETTKDSEAMLQESQEFMLDSERRNRGETRS